MMRLNSGIVDLYRRVRTLRFASNRISVAILCAVAPKLANGARTSMSILREYVWDVTG